MSKTIAITQRQILVAEHQEKRDSLSEDWYRLAEELGIHLIALPNRPEQALNMIMAFSPDGLILSNGEDLPLDAQGKVNRVQYNQRDKTETGLLNFAMQNAMPVLGVCRGCQLISATQGASLNDINDGSHIAKNHAVSLKFPKWSASQRIVNSFHRYQISVNGSTKLDILASDASGGVEALKVSGKPIWGVMWHPEREYFTSENSDGFTQYLFNQVFGI